MEIRNHSSDRCKLAQLVVFLVITKRIPIARKKSDRIEQPAAKTPKKFATFHEHHLFQLQLTQGDQQKIKDFEDRQAH